MNTRKILVRMVLGAAFLVLPSVFDTGGSAGKFITGFIPSASAHCDTLDGPVVVAARKALEAKNIDLVLSWVQKENEQEIRSAFKKTLAVRALDPAAKELADLYFFETLVRVHRSGEGAPYTGLKPAGSTQDPAIGLADKAIESGDINGLSREITEHMSIELKKRFDRMAEKKKNAGKSVDDGREYVETYVVFIHYVESLHKALLGSSSVQDEEAQESGESSLHKH